MNSPRASVRPWVSRLLLAPYPRWFREEFGAEIERHLERQRSETRYARGISGALRFLWDTLRDALAAGVRLRLEPGWEWFRDWGLRKGREEMTARMGAMTRDLKQAVRSLGRSPGFAAVFVLTLGLGIGANTAMFSAVNAVLLRPLPHEEGDRLVYLRHKAQLAGIENALFSVPEIEDYRSGVPSLASVAEFSAMDFTMLGYDTPRRVRAGIVTGNYFDVMGLAATMGRTIGVEDDGEEAPAVVVLSDAYWRRVFGGDPGVTGATLEINGRSATIVGVLEPAPPYPERTDIYVNMTTSPHHLDAAMTHDRVHRMTEVFAKLAAESTVESARSEIGGVTARIHGDHPEAYDAGSGYEVTVTPFKSQLTARARPTLLLLLGTAVLVLVIACANLANLTLTRVLRREHELAIRVSLGGSTAALRRQLLAESLILATLGAGIGILMASASLDLIIAFAERFTSRAGEITLDATVFGYALLAGVVASVFFTLVPTLPDGASVGSTLVRAGTRATGDSAGKRTQRALVVAQIGTSFVLLIGAGLLVRTMMHLDRVDPGFDTGEVLAIDIPANSAGRTGDEIRNHYLAVLEDARALPGVTQAALTNIVPLSGGLGGFTTQFEIGVEGFEPASGAPAPRADFRVVSPDFFAAMGIELLRGRTFTTTDLEESQPVVVINESMARAYFGDRDPIGQRVAWTDEVMKFLGVTPEWRTVVGVVADTRDYGVDERVVHTMYNPYPQVRWTESLLVRVSGDPEAMVPALRQTILSHDPNQPVDNVATLAQLGERSVAPRRLNTILLAGFAGLAMLIAAVGLGGVLAFSVGSRVREFGIRSALGAAQHQVWSRVLGEGAVLAGLGLGFGLLAATLLTRFLASQLVGVPTFDPLTYLVVAAVLACVVLGACWIPAWRASKVSPMEALSED